MYLVMVAVGDCDDEDLGFGFVTSVSKLSSPDPSLIIKSCQNPRGNNLGY